MKSYDDVNEAFPYKDDKGNPMFRAGQFETISFIKDSMEDGVKYIAVDAKTGSGKSVINYTVLNSIKGKGVYLTPQKQLQDQIGAEGWSDISVLKGYSGYACTYCQPMDSIKYRTNYDGEEVDMCNNMSDVETVKPDIAKLKTSVLEHIKELEGSKVKQYKTSFDNGEHFDDVMYKSYEEKMFLLSLDNSDERKPNHYKNVLKENEVVFAHNEAYKSIACPYAHLECPKKSARTISSQVKISVLSPDIMFYMNKYGGAFDNIDTLVIDEAHGFEGVIQRIFSSSLPINILRDMYGINMYPLINNEDKVEVVDIFNSSYKPYLKRVVNTLSVLGSFKGIYGIHDKVSSSKIAKSKLPYVKVYKDNCMREIAMGEADPLMDVHNAIMGNFSPIFDMVRNECDSIDGDFEDINFIINSVKKNISDNINSMKEVIAKRYNINSSSVSTNYVVWNVINELRIILKPFIDKTDSLCSIAGQDNIPFLFNVEDGNKDDIPYELRRSKLYDNNYPVEVVTTVIIDTGSIARMFFYKHAKHVVFTTGTWLYKNSMMKALGINSDNTEFHTMPSTFIKERRPVYLIRDKGLTDFSAKVHSGGYAYDTISGTRKYVDSTLKLISSIQKGLNETQGENVNILVHTNSFKISKAIAELGMYDTSKFVFHAPNNVSHYNRRDGKMIFTMTKEQFMLHSADNPDSGLVLISPSITEGVDFKHKLARAQIILKHPMPYWGDPYIQAVMGKFNIENLEVDRDIYNRLTYTTLVQQYGRVMRDESDWGLTFIVDQKSVGAIGKLMANNRERKKANIEYFIEGIKMSKRNGGGYKLMRPSKFMLEY